MRYTKSGTGRDSKEVNLLLESEVEASDAEHANGKAPASRKSSFNETQQRETTFLMRRRSSGTEGVAPGGAVAPVALRGTQANMKEHLKHLGPSNAASRPKATKYTSVKIKPGVGTIPEGAAVNSPARSEHFSPRRLPSGNGRLDGSPALKRSGGSKENVITQNRDYGTLGGHPPIHIEDESEVQVGLPTTAAEASEQARKNTSSRPLSSNGDKNRSKSPQLLSVRSPRPQSSNGKTHSSDSTSTIGSLRDEGRTKSKSRRTARSGSITENLVHVGGMKKVVLETHSSSDSEAGTAPNTPLIDGPPSDNERDDDHHQKAKKSRKRRGKRKNKSGKENGHESTPLLDQE